MENEFFKISKTKVKRDVSKNVCYGERHFFSGMKEGYNVSCVKILMF